jgi:glycosyltransferase involved in cell wall biosynthesis
MGTVTPHPSAVVCIPTYRRPRQLARLLRALGRQRGVDAFEIVVGNNEERPLSVYPELSQEGLPAIHVVQVALRGVSAVRNAMVADVLARHADVRWIACLDDDQEPADDWLAELLAAGRLHDADLVGGPVIRTPPLPTFWSERAADTSYLPTAAGPTAMLNEAGNLLMSVRFLRSLDRAPFSLDFGRTGGEDYEFFLHAKSRGARLAWAPDARVAEPMPADRLGFRSYVWRFYAIAAYQARADRVYRGTGYVIASIVVTGLKAPLIVLRSLLRDRSARLAIGLIVQYAAMVAGRIVGLLGARAERYGGDSS